MPGKLIRAFFACLLSVITIAIPYGLYVLSQNIALFSWLKRVAAWTFIGDVISITYVAIVFTGAIIAAFISTMTSEDFVAITIFDVFFHYMSIFVGMIIVWLAIVPLIYYWIARFLAWATDWPLSYLL